MLDIVSWTIHSISVDSSIRYVQLLLQASELPYLNKLSYGISFEKFFDVLSIGPKSSSLWELFHDNKWHFLKKSKKPVILDFFFTWTHLKFTLSQILQTHTYLIAAPKSTQKGQSCPVIFWQVMESRIRYISAMLRRFLGVWQTRKTRTMPRKTMAKLSSCFRRACWVEVAEVRDIDNWRRLRFLTSL